MGFYNRSNIMKNAWYIFHRNMGYYTFAESLKISWQKEKEEMARVAKVAASSSKTPEQIKAQKALFILEMKDRWDEIDHAKARELNAIIARAA